MSIVQIKGLEFKIVTAVEEKVMRDFMEAIEDGFIELKKLGGGACGNVYDFGDYVIKNNVGNLGSNCNDGKVLEALQGLPLVPTIYAYSTDERYHLIQKIKGNTTARYLEGWDPIDPPPIMDVDEWSSKLEFFFQQSIERGWLPRDCHAMNSMVDEQGNFWVVDYGLFREAHKEGKLNKSSWEDLQVQIENLCELSRS